MTQPEARLSKKTCELLERELPNCIAEKVHGTPLGRCTLDIRGSVDGFAFEIEAKMPGNEPSDRQKARMRILKSKQVITGWFVKPEEALVIVRDGYFEALKRIGEVNIGK